MRRSGSGFTSLESNSWTEVILSRVEQVVSSTSEGEKTISSDDTCYVSLTSNEVGKLTRDVAKSDHCKEVHEGATFGGVVEDELGDVATGIDSISDSFHGFGRGSFALQEATVATDDLFRPVTL